MIAQNIVLVLYEMIRILIILKGELGALIRLRGLPVLPTSIPLIFFWSCIKEKIYSKILSNCAMELLHQQQKYMQIDSHE